MRCAPQLEVASKNTDLASSMVVSEGLECMRIAVHGGPVCAHAHPKAGNKNLFQGRERRENLFHKAIAMLTATIWHCPLRKALQWAVQIPQHPARRKAHGLEEGGAVKERMLVTRPVPAAGLNRVERIMHGMENAGQKPVEIIATQHGYCIAPLRDFVECIGSIQQVWGSQ